MQIRPALAEDLPALTEIYNQAILQTESTCYLEEISLEERQEWWKQHQNPSHPAMCLEEEGRVTGYASLSAWMPGPIYVRTVEVSVFLLPQSRGKGAGAALLREILHHAKNLGHHVVIARVWSENAVSLSLCRACGFEIVGCQREVGYRDGRALDCVILQLILS